MYQICILAWAWKQQDKVSSAWLLCLPVHGTKLSNAEFSEAAAAKLCLESPACKGRVGEPIRGRVVIDKYGDNIQSTALPGDHWRSRHNAALHHLYNACQWAGLPCEVEMHNHFAGVMHQQGLSRAEQMRQYQGIVPGEEGEVGEVEGALEHLVCLQVVWLDSPVLYCTSSR